MLIDRNAIKVRKICHRTIRALAVFHFITYIGRKSARSYNNAARKILSGIYFNKFPITVYFIDGRGIRLKITSAAKKKNRELIAWQWGVAAKNENNEFPGEHLESYCSNLAPYRSAFFYDFFPAVFNKRICYFWQSYKLCFRITIFI